LLDKNTTIPCKVSHPIEDDGCTIVISFLGKRFSIDIKEEFGYSPKAAEITVEIGCDPTEIMYSVKDTETKKEFFISQFDLLDYDITVNNEETTWADSNKYNL